MAKKKFESYRAFKFSKMWDGFMMVKDIMKSHKFLFFTYLILCLLQVICYALTPFMVKNLIETLNPAGVIKTPTLFGLTLTWQDWLYANLAVFLATVILEFCIDYIGFRTQKIIEVGLRLKALTNLVELDMSFYSKNRLGETMAKIMDDSSSGAETFVNFIINVVYTVFLNLFLILSIFFINVELAIFVTCLFSIIFAATWLIFIYYRRTLIVAFETRLNVDSILTDKLMNVRLVKASGSENEEVKNFDKLHKHWGKKVDKTIWYAAFINAISVFSGTAITTFSISFIILIKKDQSAEIPSLVTSFLIVSMMMAYSIQQLPITIRSLTRFCNCCLRLKQIIDPKSIIDLTKSKKEINEIEEIKLENITFVYPEDDSQATIIEDFNFTFKKGKSYAFVGESGVGKSTISRLLLRLYDPYKGSVKVNGIDLKEIDLSHYLQHVGYVDQEPQILYGTVLENLTYSIKDWTMEQVIEASKKASFHEFVSKLSDGYETILGEHGFMLSGGQKQRLIIARMFLKNPSLIILDEATSALDNVVEKEIQHSLDKLSKGRTTVAIAHRLSTIKNVDEILVLGRNKNIIEKGTFEELIKLDGQFSKLYRLGLV